ncbi:hypothetical protein PMI42_04875 [Bradyrhizobium sp. YR681]|uniref:hypothetical protein n=1 Tax=Bradyrhizobium sp. YR681 TaxID=1144344 RepID=UPI0002711498|nr:hypothetical protein [Bradyrhizobium sp. YR681]EJN11860.1 hypothetical protein PMI42_04875 [Bradyrhizobium sp. YR681]
MTFNEAELAALDSGVARFGDLFRLEVDPVARLWLGAGDLDVGTNVYDTAGGIYKGLGQIGPIPEFDAMINGAASRIEVVLSGVSGQIAEVAQGDDTDQIKNKRAAFGFVLFGDDLQPLGSAHWYAHYRADVLSSGSEPVLEPTGVPVRWIKLSCGSQLTRRRRPARSYFSDKDQQARFPGDLFCSLTPRYVTGFNKPWPVLV